MADDVQWSRYQRVKQILNRAQGSVCPSYQGYGKFWQLPLAEFLTVEIYGVRMIAPASHDNFSALAVWIVDPQDTQATVLQMGSTPP